jgi:hypothetical protein
MSYILLSMLLRTWKVSCHIIFYRCYCGLGGLVVLYFALCVIEDLGVSCLIFCYRCYRELGRFVVFYFSIDVIEDLED